MEWEQKKQYKNVSEGCPREGLPRFFDCKKESLGQGNGIFCFMYAHPGAEGLFGHGCFAGGSRKRKGEILNQLTEHFKHAFLSAFAALFLSKLPNGIFPIKQHNHTLDDLLPSVFERLCHDTTILANPDCFFCRFFCWPQSLSLGIQNSAEQDVLSDDVLRFCLMRMQIFLNKESGKAADDIYPVLTGP